MTVPLRVALYARVSTLDQSLDPQLYALQRYAGALGWEVPQRFWIFKTARGRAFGAPIRSRRIHNI